MYSISHIQQNNNITFTVLRKLCLPVFCPLETIGLIHNLVNKTYTRKTRLSVTAPQSCLSLLLMLLRMLNSIFSTSLCFPCYKSQWEMLSTNVKSSKLDKGYRFFVWASEDPPYGFVEVNCPDMKCIGGASHTELVEGQIKVRKTHTYHWQVQGQLMVTSLSWCDVLTDTRSDFIMERL